MQVDLQEAMQDGGVATQGGQYKAMPTRTWKNKNEWQRIKARIMWK